MDGAEGEVLAHLGFPAARQAEEPPANTLERLNKEASAADGIFPNEAGIRRLTGAVLMEQNEEWLLQSRHLPQHTMPEAVPPKQEPDALPG